MTFFQIIKKNFSLLSFPVKESKTKKAVSFTFLLKKRKSKTKEKECSYSALFFYLLSHLLSFAVKESKGRSCPFLFAVA